MQVPLLDLKGQYAPLRAAIETAIREVCDSQRFILGPRVAELEAQVAAYSETQHGIGLASGTDALLVALMALDIGPGDEVITSPFTFFATAGVIARLGARPLFCDIDPQTFNLSPAAVEATIANALRSLGRPARESPHRRRSSKRCCPCISTARWRTWTRSWRSRGGIGWPSWRTRRKRSAQSSPTADARAASATWVPVVLSHEEPRRVRRRRHVRDERRRARGAPANSARSRRRAEVLPRGDRRQLSARRAASRRTADQASASRRMDAGAASQCARITMRCSARRTWAVRSRRRSASPASGTSINQYVIRVPRRDALRKHLEAHGVGTEIYYPLSLHEQRCFAYLGHAPERLSERARGGGRGAGAADLSRAQAGAARVRRPQYR